MERRIARSKVNKEMYRRKRWMDERIKRLREIDGKKGKNKQVPQVPHRSISSLPRVIQMVLGQEVTLTPGLPRPLLEMKWKKKRQ